MSILRLLVLCFVFSLSSVYGAFELSGQGGFMTITEKSNSSSEIGTKEVDYLVMGAGHYLFDVSEILTFRLGGFYQYSSYSQSVDVSGFNATL